MLVERIKHFCNMFESNFPHFSAQWGDLALAYTARILNLGVNGVLIHMWSSSLMSWEWYYLHCGENCCLFCVELNIVKIHRSFFFYLIPEKLFSLERNRSVLTNCTFVSLSREKQIASEEAHHWPTEVSSC